MKNAYFLELRIERQRNILREVMRYNQPLLLTRFKANIKLNYGLTDKKITEDIQTLIDAGLVKVENNLIEYIGER